jgi:hypothetical protein
MATIKCPVCGASENDGRPHDREVYPEVCAHCCKSTATRLEYLRGEIRAERISWGELAELQGLAEHIEPDDVELLEWAGVPEFPEDEEE